MSKSARFPESVTGIHPGLTRRDVLRYGGAGLVAAVFGGVSARSAGALGDLTGTGLAAADVNGWRLAPSYTSRVVATSAQAVVAGGAPWHTDPDGGAAFPTADGGWIYVSNCERANGQGGVSMVRFDRDARVVDGRTLLQGSSVNCAGGAMPWGTWLSCEERPLGLVWEIDPTGDTPPVARPSMGLFQHEAAAADPERRAIYMTEDRPDGGFYRFRPAVWGDLSSGVLDILCEGAEGVYWVPVPDPSAAVTFTHQQIGSTKPFNGGEGMGYADGEVWWTTKGDNRVWSLLLDEMQLTVLYDDTNGNPVLTGVDNLIVTPWGDLLVVEDGGDMQIVLLTRSGQTTVLGQLVGVAGSELTGPSFDPSGTRLYLSSQRNPGRTYEISGPFPAPTRRYEEGAAGLRYTGAWSTWTHPSQSAGQSKVASEVGATLTATVRGGVVRILGQRGPARGRAEVLVDGVSRGIFDSYAARYSSRRPLFAASDLGDGDHVVELRFVGVNPLAAAGALLVVDAVEAAELVVPSPPSPLVTVEHTSPAVQASGGWFVWQHPSQSGGSALVGVGVDEALEVRFSGPSFRWVGQRGPARAIAEVLIDDVSHGRVDTYDEQYRSRVVLAAFDDLGPGDHRATVRLVGANPATVGDPALVVDTLEAQQFPAEAVLVRAEETTPAAVYAGPWFAWAHPSQSGGAAMVAPGSGCSVTVVVRGRSFRLIGQRGPERGVAEVLVDGVSLVQVDTYAPAYRSQQVLFAVADLATGVHRVEVRWVGANPAATGTPAVLVDAFEAEAFGESPVAVLAFPG